MSLAWLELQHSIETAKPSSSAWEPLVGVGEDQDGVGPFLRTAETGMSHLFFRVT